MEKIRKMTTLRRFTCCFALVIALMVGFSVFDCDATYAASAPKLKSVSYYESGSTCNAELIWASSKGKKYYVYRKIPGGSWKKVAKVKGKKTKTTYIDKSIGKGKNYIYTVRLGKSYDTTGIKLLGTTEVKADIANNKSVITWTQVPEATSYRIYRKANKNGSYVYIATVGASTLEYTDVYYNSIYNGNASQKKNIRLVDGNFVDLSVNNLVYTVRAVNNKNSKYSYGLYSKEGDFHLEAPTIVNVKESGSTATVTLGTVPNADGYYVYSTDDKDNWNRVSVKSPGTFQFDKNVTVSGTVPKAKYYAVRAYTKKNGSYVKSTHNLGVGYDIVTTANRKYNENILWLGDSITYGSPYYKGRKYNSSIKRDVSPEWHIFSMSNRVNELTGNLSTASLRNEYEPANTDSASLKKSVSLRKTHYYNPSIPGSTYYTPITKYENGIPYNLNNGEYVKLGYNHTPEKGAAYRENGDKTPFDRGRIVDEVVNPIINKTMPGRTGMLGTLKPTASLEAYDVIVLAAGTNDYLDCAPISNKATWNKLKDYFKEHKAKTAEEPSGTTPNEVTEAPAATVDNDVVEGEQAEATEEANNEEETSEPTPETTPEPAADTPSEETPESVYWCDDIKYDVKDPTSADYEQLFDKTTFYGAYNTIMKRIEDASKARVEAGKPPIKVVAVDLFYSDRTYGNGSNCYPLTNRYVTENKTSQVKNLGEGGHTLTYYQECLDTLNDIWSENSSYIKVYKYHGSGINSTIANSENCRYNASDNLHFTKYVYGQFGNDMADFMMNKVFSDKFTAPKPSLFIVDELADEIGDIVEEPGEQPGEEPAPETPADESNPATEDNSSEGTPAAPDSQEPVANPEGIVEP